MVPTSLAARAAWARGKTAGLPGSSLNARRGRPRGTSGRSSITPTRAARQKGKAAQRAAAYAAFPGRAYRRALTAPSSRSARLDPSARRWCEQAVTLPPTRLRKQERSGSSTLLRWQRRLLVEGAPLENQSNAC